MNIELAGEEMTKARLIFEDFFIVHDIGLFEMQEQLLIHAFELSLVTEKTLVEIRDIMDNVMRPFSPDKEILSKLNRFNKPVYTPKEPKELKKNSWKYINKRANKWEKE